MNQDFDVKYAGDTLLYQAFSVFVWYLANL